MSEHPLPQQARQEVSGPTFMPWKDFGFSQLTTGPLYFYVGAGLSISAGLVGWNEMACLIWWYLKHYEKANPPECPPTPEENAKFLQWFVEDTEGKGVRAKILSRDSMDFRGLGRTALLNMMLRYRKPRIALRPVNGEAEPHIPEDEPRLRPGREPSAEDLALQSLIWRSRCSGVLTSNYDMLLEHAYSLFHHGAALRSYRYNANFLRYLLSNPQFVLKLHGDINDIATMQFDPYRAWEKKKKKKKECGAFVRKEGREPRGLDLQRVYNAILERGHMVYVGCGFCDPTIEKLHGFWQSRRKSLQSNPRTPLNCRIALMPKDQAPDAGRRFKDIQFLTFERECWHEVRNFLERIVAARSGAPEPWRACSEATDLHQQIFLSWNTTTKPVRHLKTELWTCGASFPDEVPEVGALKRAPHAVKISPSD